MKKFSLTLFWSLTASILVLAQTNNNWQYILRTKDDELVYINKQRLRNNSINVRRVWVKYASISSVIVDFDPYLIEDEKARAQEIKRREELSAIRSKAMYSHTLELIECNCKKATIRTIRALRYSKAGTVMDSNDSFGKAEDIIPDTIGEAIFNHVCHNGKKEKKK